MRETGERVVSSIAFQEYHQTGRGHGYKRINLRPGSSQILVKQLQIAIYMIY